MSIRPNAVLRGRFADRIQLTAAKFQEIQAVNTAVNTAVAPVTDLELYGKPEVWTYPTANKGDCEDYVLLKRRTLIEHGYPESTLLITVVRDENNEGHAVLTVRTDQGDFILDNKRRRSCSGPTRPTPTSSGSPRRTRWSGSRFCRRSLCRKPRCQPRTATSRSFRHPSPTGTLLRPGDHPPPIPDPTGPLLEPVSAKRPAPFFPRWGFRFLQRQDQIEQHGA